MHNLTQVLKTQRNTCDMNINKAEHMMYCESKKSSDLTGCVLKAVL